MISEECDLDRFIEGIKDLTYHEFLTFTLKEGYASDDVLTHKHGLVPPDLPGPSEQSGQ